MNPQDMLGRRLILGIVSIFVAIPAVLYNMGYSALIIYFIMIGLFLAIAYIVVFKPFRSSRSRSKHAIYDISQKKKSPRKRDINAE